MCPVEHHCFATIGTNYQSGILVLLIHLCGAAFVFTHPLYNIPDLFANDGRMRIFKHEAFFPWVFHFALVLIGFGAETVVHSVAYVDLIFQHVGYRIPRPVIWALGIQSCMGHAVFDIGVHGGC